MASDLVKYKLVFYSPEEPLDKIKDALFEAGAGRYPDGKYSHSCFQSQGLGQYRPEANSRSYAGTVGEIEKVPDIKVEIICVGEEVVRNAIVALKKTHPYEETGYEVYKMENF